MHWEAAGNSRKKLGHLKSRIALRDARSACNFALSRRPLEKNTSPAQTAERGPPWVT